MSFRDLKQNRQAQLEKIAEEYSKHGKFEGGGSNNDDRFWYPDVDKAGNGLAIIRFLPAAEGEDTPTIKIFTRSFQGPTGKWYINNDLGTIGQEDPVNDLNRKLVGGKEWAEVPEKVKEVVRKQKRRTTYVSNVYIIKDQLHPENEGKVFLFKYGPKIRDMINEKMNPSFEGDDRLNPFDLWNGPNLKIKIRRQDKFRNYDKSEWETPSALFDNDEEIENVWKQTHKLQPFIAPDQFKSRAELEKQLTSVLGNTDRIATPAIVESESAPALKEEKPAWESDDDDIDPKFFENLGDE